MTVDELLSELHRIGARLSAEEGRLVCDAPRGALTPELRDAIRASKPALVAALASAAGAAARTPALRRVARDGGLPLGLVQQRMWVLQGMDVESTVFNLPGAWKLTGELDVPALQAAFGAVVGRHEVLRARFELRDGEPVQFFDARLPDELLPLEDLSAVAPGERDGALLARFALERARRFDLRCGPVWVARLYRLTEEEHVFFFMPHHIVWDGWSFDVLLDDLGAEYQAMLTRTPSPLPELPVQYADYVLWHRAVMNGPEVERQLDYWRDTLAGDLPLLDLPTDRPRPDLLSTEGDRVLFHVSLDVVDGLTQVGRRERATLFMVVLAVYRVLLHQLTGQSDVTVGVPIQNRLRAEAERLLGVFVNTLVVRIPCDGRTTFRELVRATRDLCLGAYEHQDIPFERLVEELRPGRSLNHTPLYQTLFTFQDITGRPRSFGPVELSQVHVDVRVAPTDLLLGFMVSSSGALGVLDYATDLFERERVERMGDHLVELLRRYSDPAGSALDESVSDAAVPRELLAVEAQDAQAEASEEERALLLEWARGPAPTLETRDVLARVETVAVESRDRPAVADRYEILTYADLWDRSGRVAAGLVARGVRRGSIVGACFERSAKMIVGLLGIWRSGCAYLPLDPGFPDERLAFMIEDAGCALIVTDGHAVAPTTEVGEAALDELETEGRGCAPLGTDASAVPDPTTSEGLAYIIYTSGSTGRPKGVEVTHGNLVNFLEAMTREPGLTSADVLVAITTLSFDISGLELWGPLSVGARLEIADDAEVHDGKLLAERLTDTEATIVQATPATWRMLLDAGWGGRLRKVLCGGEAFPKELIDPLLARADEVWNMYGPTETTIWSTIARLESTPEGAVSIGRPIANTRVYVMRADGRLAAPGVPGELWIGGDGVARGYHGRPELTAERFVPDPFVEGGRVYRTGDMARWRGDGQLEHLGRLDDQVKVRGHRIELGEIESVLAGHEAVRSAVAAVHGEAGDARLSAFFVMAQGGQTTGSELRRYLKDRLPDYMVPGVIAEMDALPLTPNGKVDRRALPDPLATAERTAFAPPSTDTELRLAQVWSKLLGVRTVGKHDNFFELGGHSLLAIRAVTELQESGLRVDPRAFFFNSLEQIAQAATAA